MLSGDTYFFHNYLTFCKLFKDILWKYKCSYKWECFFKNYYIPLCIASKTQTLLIWCAKIFCHLLYMSWWGLAVLVKVTTKINWVKIFYTPLVIMYILQKCKQLHMLLHKINFLKSKSLNAQMPKCLLCIIWRLYYLSLFMFTTIAYILQVCMC